MAALSSLIATLLVPAWLPSPARAQGAGPPSVPAANVYHLYIVDVSSVAQNLTQARSYVTFRWLSLSGLQNDRQRGLVVLLNGVRTMDEKKIPLSLSDPDQEAAIAAGFEEAARWRNTGILSGLELEQLADRVRQHIEAHILEEVRRFHRENRANGMLIVVHLIGDDILYTARGGGTVSLEQTEFADGCFGTGALAGAVRSFPSRLRQELGQGGRAELRGLLVIVPSGSQRHVPTAERAAALQVFGDALFDNSARVVRDGLDCVEVAPAVDIQRRNSTACGPGSNAVSPRPAFDSRTCVSVSDQKTESRRADLMRQRIVEIIVPLVQGLGILSSPAAAQDQASVLPAPPQQHVTPPPLTPPAPQPRPAQPQPQPTAPSVSSAPAQQHTTALPAPQIAPSATPVAQPQQAPPPLTPPVPQPQPMPAQPQPQPTALPPRDAGQLPEPERTSAQRMTAVTVRTDMPSGFHSSMNVNGRLSGANGAVEIDLVPLSDAAREATNVTSGAYWRLPSGSYALRARVSSEAHCAPDGSLSFQFDLYGFQFGPNPPGEFSVTLGSACRATERDIPFASVTIP